MPYGVPAHSVKSESIGEVLDYVVLDARGGSCWHMKGGQKEKDTSKRIAQGEKRETSPTSNTHRPMYAIHHTRYVVSSIRSRMSLPWLLLSCPGMACAVTQGVMAFEYDDQGLG